MLEFEQEGQLQNLTLDDLNDNSIQTVYDAYVSYADSDISFVQNLCDFLESPQVGLKLFVRERDLLIGQMQFHAFTELMEKRCKRLLIVLSPEFLNSAECEFQTRFTMSLQIQERQRRLIPIVYRSCELPALIRFLSKIDLSRGDQIPQWTWRKLIYSLKTQSVDASFLPNALMASPTSATSSSTNTASVMMLPTTTVATTTNQTLTVCSPNKVSSTSSSSSSNTNKSIVPSQKLNHFNSTKSPIITELSSSNSIKSHDYDDHSSTHLSTKLVSDGESNKSTSNSKPLLSRLWKKIHRTPLKR